MKKQWSLAARLAVIFSLSIAPAVGFEVYDLLSHHVHQMREARSQTAVVARALAQQHRMLVENTRTLLRAIAELPQLQKARGPECRKLLQKFLDENGPYLDLTLAGGEGVMRCSARFIDKPLDATQLPYFQRVLATGDFSLGDYQVGRITGIPIIVFGYPVKDQDGQINAVLGAGVALSFFERALAGSGLPKGSVLALIDSDRKLIARIPSLPDRAGRRSILGEALDSGKDQDTVELTGADGVRRIATYTRVQYEGNSVYFAAAVPRDAIYGPVMQRLLFYTLGLSITALVVIFLAWRFGHNFIVAPLSNVRDAAMRIAGGDWSARTHPRRPFREAAELAGSFNDMAASIEEQWRRIKRLNRVYAVLSDINGVLLRTREKKELIEEATRIAVQKGGFAMVVIAELNAHGAIEEILSHTGAEAANVDSLRGLLAGTGAGLTATLRQALARGEHLVVNDLRGRPEEPLAAWLAGLELGSIAFFPARVAEHSRILLCLGAREDGFFDADEVRLLRELAADTGLGLGHIFQAKELHFLQNHDPVTGLYNRDRFEDYLGQSLARAGHRNRYVAVLTLDVNDFRHIVDAMGKHSGDAIVRDLAVYLSSCVRDGDMVAKLGRDTFGIALCDLGNEGDAADVLDKIITGLPSRVGDGADEVFFTVRVGAAMFPRDGGTAVTILSNAELAMQSVRGEAGTSFAFHSKGADIEAHDRIHIEAALRPAMSNGELSVYYQPIVRVDTREVVAAEALMRWNSPTLGNVSPARFIPIAEHRNLILPLGDWLLQSVAQWSIRWRAKQLPRLKFGINVSMRQLADPKFPERVKAILSAAGVDPARHPLAAEITESQLMAAPGKVLHALEQLREMRISLAIDDFGTGYSSLSYLTRLPIDTLKIDQSFVAAIETPSGLAVVKAMVNLAHTLNLQVVAEGVETEAQFERLRELRCDCAQGYLFSRAVPGDQFESFVVAASLASG